MILKMYWTQKDNFFLHILLTYKKFFIQCHHISLAPLTVDFNELKMEDSTVIHDEEKSSDGFGSYFDLGDGTAIFQSGVISDLSIFHPTLYPVDLVNDKLETAITLPSLTRLCCVRIAKEARFLKEDACTRLPVNLYPAILREAIRSEFRKIAFILMPIWPSKVISMIDVVAGVLNYFAVLVNKEFKKPSLFFPPKGIVRLIRLFFYVVKKRLTPHLRVLDLRGIALHDLMVAFLLREIIFISNDVSLLDDYCIFIDCEIKSSNTAEELTNFLKTRETKIHLHIRKLNVAYLDNNKIWKLLEQISPTELFGLQISTLHSEYMMTSTILTKFSKLIALDLKIIPKVNWAVPTLPLLPQLRRLRFRITWHDYSIDVIPKSVLRQLEHLNIESSSPDALIEINLRHLISALPLRLSEVVLLGWKVITAHLHLWKSFLLSIASTLKMLVLQNCFENDGAHFGTILSYILPSVNILFLDLSTNFLSNETLHEHVPKLNSLPRLKRIVLPKYAKLFLIEDDSDDEDDEVVVTRRCRVLERKMLIGKENPIQIEWG